MTDVDKAAERLAARIKTASADDPLLRKFESDAAEFLYQQGFDISTPAGCRGALAWLESARVEEAFWNEDAGSIECSVDWYLGEARLDAMMKIVKGRIAEFEGIG